MTFGELLQTGKDAIVRRWLEEILATYPEDTATAFGREKDPFANPVGHALRVGTRAIFEAVLDGTDTGKTRHHLHEIIRIRAVQQFGASQAVGFIFLLKGVIRAELGMAVSDGQFSAELAQVERRIDRLALSAFDAFVQCREQVYELRVNEVKRNVSWVVDKMNRRCRDRERECSSA